jgi:PTH1 family peptidyl-tRNA hydrolase
MGFFQRTAHDSQDPTGRRLVVGLGNPGERYVHTRHNLGFRVVEELARRHQLKFKASRFCQGVVAEGKILGRPCALLLPLTFMNHSGITVNAAVSWYKALLPDFLVVLDDLNLEFGQLRLRDKGSDGGHNGLASVIQHLGSQDFSRLRMGIGAPPPRMDAADFVLAEFGKEERKVVDSFVGQGAEGSELWLQNDIGKVMSQINKRKENG